MLNRTSAYALEAVLALASAAADERVRAAELAVVLDLPPNYLGKILNGLAHDGILESVRGPAGGFRLALPPEQMTIERVISRFEDVGLTRQCLLGRGRCSDQDACPMHAEWKKVSQPLFGFLRETTIADLLASARADETADNRSPRKRKRKRAPRTAGGRSRSR